MSLDTKRAEIRKLEEQAQQREDALKRSESMLEEDAMRFDAFLKENDYKAVEAIRKAEQETKAKQVPEARFNPISPHFLPPCPAAAPHPASSGAHCRDQAHLQPNRVSEERHGALRGAAGRLQALQGLPLQAVARGVAAGAGGAHRSNTRQPQGGACSRWSRLFARGVTLRR